MNSKCFLLLAFAFLGASAAPFTTALNNVGPTVAETVITPFHRTDAVATPCGRSVVHTTVPYAIGTGAGFLGAGVGIGAGVGAGTYSGVGLGGYAGAVSGGYGYPGIFAGGLAGYHGVGDVAGVGIVGGLGGYTAGGIV